MIIFVIPFRAKGTTTNWEKSCMNLERTIDSIFNQTNTEFRCILACNEKPEFTKSFDKRLEIIILDIPVPHNWIEMARDKNWKLLVIAQRIREMLENGSDIYKKEVYVMPVDGDDLLNCKIAEYVNSHPNENGFVSRSGYIDWGKRYLTIYRKMYTFCGSCNIIKMRIEDLPEKLPDPKYCHDKEMAGELNVRYPIRWDHNVVVDRYAKMGKPFKYLPFKSTIYIKNTGENISDIHSFESETEKKDKRFHPIAFLRKLNPFQYKRISSKLRKEFFYYR